MKHAVLVGSFIFKHLLLFSQVGLLELTILDTLVVKRSNDEAVKIRVSLKRNSNQGDSLYVFRFSQFISSSFILNDTTDLKIYEQLHHTETGLIYFIQTTKGEIINSLGPIIVCYANPEDIDKHWRTVTIVDEDDLTIISKELNKEDLIKFNSAKIIFNESDSVLYITVYPLIGAEHPKLSEGMYYLTLFYAFKKDDWKDENESQVSLENFYQGILKSNPVKLKVETSKKSKKR